MENKKKKKHEHKEDCHCNEEPLCDGAWRGSQPDDEEGVPIHR